jgi:3'-phosphoadenosine 5'-phosphosulfate sulfotransferase (PAPS reductase)/FAD synthetase
MQETQASKYNYYKLDTPGIISLSGGRTSGYMLWKIMEAYGGTLPNDIKVVFANTGLEHPETYNFIKKIETEWNVPVVWAEYQYKKPLIKIVTAETASKDGTPFADIIQKKQFLPNPLMRFCTSELKINTIRRFAWRIMRFKEWSTAVGLRADEPYRAHKLVDRHRETVVAPLFKMGVTIEEVNSFWQANAFDLNLPYINNPFNNCVGCFLKSRSTLNSIAIQAPEYFNWWANQEKLLKAKFRKEFPTYLEMRVPLSINGALFEDTLPCACTD